MFVFILHNHQLAKPEAASLRTIDFHLIFFLDDILVIGSSMEQCRVIVDMTH